MKKKRLLNSLSMFLASFIWIGVYGVTPITYEAKAIQTSGGSKSVKLVNVDLNNPSIKVEVAYAKGKVGEVDSLANIANQIGSEDRKIVAAINGTFFDAYTDGQPVGNVQKDGVVEYIGANGVTIGFTEDNKVKVENLKYTIQGATGENYGWPDNWFAWGINRYDEREDAVQILTPSFGKTTKVHNKLSVVTRNNKIVEVKQGEAPIYADGYTVVVGDKSLKDRFTVGETIDYRIIYEDYINQNPLDWDDVKGAIGAGPSLVRDGKMVYMPEKEGFKDPKILSHSSQRSFIGVTKEDKLIIGTVNGVTIKQLSEIAYKLGLVEAINLDGGASSGLLYKGEYKTSPGRLISNAIVITEGKVEEKPIKVLIDDKELTCSVKPIMKNNQVMVPMKTIFEVLGITTTWDGKTKTVVAKSEDRVVEIPLGKDAKLNNRVIHLEVPAISHQDTTMIPVKLLKECFNLSVVWDAKERNVRISSK